MAKKVLCVSTWGDPSQWRYADYKPDEETAPAFSETVSAFSTLSMLERLKKPDLMLVVVSDTLAARSGRRFSSYEDVEEAARAYAERYLCGVEAEIIVLPGIMRISGSDPEYEFKADLRDYRTLFLYEVYSRAAKLGSTEELEIVLDISHGVNYMPALALDAVQEAAAMASVLLARAVRLEVYQADPYPMQYNGRLGRSREDPCKPSDSIKPPELTYNCIRSIETRPWDLVRYMVYHEKDPEKEKKMLTDQRGLEGEITGIVKQAFMTLGAFRIGALIQLAALVRKSNVEDVREILERAVSLWRDKRSIREEGNMLMIKSGTRFCEGFRALLHAHSVIMGISRLIGEEREGICFSELKELKKILEGSQVTKTLVNREISKLEKLKNEKKLSEEWRIYSEYLKPPSREEEPGMDVIKRDFIAHAGFYSDFIEVRLRDGEPELRVRDDRWGTIKEILEEVAHGA